MTPTARRSAYVLLALAAVAAGVVHLAFVPEHLDEWRPLGIGFLVAGVLQVVWGGAMAAGARVVCCRSAASGRSRSSAST